MVDNMSMTVTDKVVIPPVNLRVVAEMTLNVTKTYSD